MTSAVFPLARGGAKAEDLQVVPVPLRAQHLDGDFLFRPNISCAAVGGFQNDTEFFASELRKVTGWPVPVRADGNIRFIKDDSLKNGYKLVVGPDGVEVRASGGDQLFYGFQTLRQMGPAALFSTVKEESLSEGWSIPCVEIEDEARYSWRGVLVDVSRCFQTKEEMMKLLDSMAMVKLNVLHWHLTDDQGWRPEIKAYPKLTAGSKKFYSQDDLREIVAYASQRGITIVPEIDVPGHSGAVAKAYPHLCVAKPDGKGAHNVYDVSKPEVYVFLETVIKELSAIFPGDYFHLGADEVGKGAWRKDPGVQAYMKEHKMKDLHALQAHFVGKVSALIRKYDRMPIAWDEALEGGANQGLAIMSWRGVQPGMKAAEEGHQVVLCPVSALYFDRTQSRSKAHPRGYSSNTVGLSQSYFFEPRIPTLSPEAQANILGAQGCVWGEWITGGDHLQRQVMLRGVALAEALWSPRSSLDWEGFQKRLVKHRARLDAAKTPYWWEPESTPVQVFAWQDLKGKEDKVIDVTAVVKKPGLHEFLFHYKQGRGSFNIYKAELLKDGRVVAVDEHGYTATVEPRRPNQYYRLTVPDFKPGAKYELRYRIEAVKGGASGVVMLVPPLEPDQYGDGRTPESKANQSNQKQPDEL